MASIARLASALVASMCIGMVAPAAAQKYPDRPIRMVVPYAPGGSIDTLSRLLAPHFSEALGQNVVVENRPGGGAIIGTGSVATAQPDGYTILMADIAFGANPALHSKLPYDTLADFEPVILVATFPTMLAVPKALAANTLGEFVAMAKAKPGTLNYASAGLGSVAFLAAELFKDQNRLDIVHIPYQSGGQAITSVLGGQTQMTILTPPTLKSHVQAGTIRALAVTGAQRQETLPDVPTFIEAGFPAFDVALWAGILVPAGTPPAIVAKLNADINRVLASPDVKRRIAEIGTHAAGGTPEQFTKFIKSDVSRWQKLIKPSMRDR